MSQFSTPSEYETIAKAITFIQDNFKRQPSLGEIAEIAQQSPAQFTKMFSAWAGISPKQYLQHVCSSFAKSLMKGGNFEPGEVARLTGLKDAGRLNDLFLSVESMTLETYNNAGSNLVIKYGYYDTPFGEILIASTDKGICKLSFVELRKVEGRYIPLRQSMLFELEKEWPAAAFLEDQGANEFLVRRIFGDQPFSEETANIKLNVKGSPFQIKVWEALLRIPRGGMTTYTEVAKLIGQPKAARAVGTAVGRNPIALLIPCHRVIKQSGSLSGYRWTSERKLSILNWEKCQIYRHNVA